MTPVAIDPTQTRVRPPARPPSRLGRTALLVVLGGIGLVGLSVGANSLMSGLAGPQLAKPRLVRQAAADWPDLKDGIPALAPAPGVAKPAAAAAEIAPSPPAQPPLAVAPIPLRDVEPPEAAARPAKPLPSIENADVIPAAKPVGLVAVIRTAALVGPLGAETTRARAALSSFAALTPEPASVQPPSAQPSSAQPSSPQPISAQPVPPRKKPAQPVARARAPATPVAEASAGPAVAAVEPEPEQTEVFGVKVPSLAPVGRKFVEGVEALGNAVKNLPDQF